MRTTVRLDEDLLRAAKIKAATEGRTLTSLLEEGLRRVLERRVSEDKVPFVPGPYENHSLPVFDGGPQLTEAFRQTGIDIDKTGAVLAWLDEQEQLTRRSGDPE